MVQIQQLSQVAYDRLKDEYAQLTTAGRIDIAKKIETARELGDLSENGDYHAAKEEQGKMEGRIAHLSSILENVEIVKDVSGGDTVQAGSTISICYADDDEAEKYLIGSIEERLEDIEVISPTSPLGEALVGAKSGDTVTYEAPGGTLEVEVISIN
jgi:transcription elongation factor GreA